MILWEATWPNAQAAKRPAGCQLPRPFVVGSLLWYESYIPVVPCLRGRETTPPKFVHTPSGPKRGKRLQISRVFYTCPMRVRQNANIRPAHCRARITQNPRATNVWYLCRLRRLPGHGSKLGSTTLWTKQPASSTAMRHPNSLSFEACRFHWVKGYATIPRQLITIERTDDVLHKTAFLVNFPVLSARNGQMRKIEHAKYG